MYSVLNDHWLVYIFIGQLASAKLYLFLVSLEHRTVISFACDYDSSSIRMTCPIRFTRLVVRIFLMDWASVIVNKYLLVWHISSVFAPDRASMTYFQLLKVFFHNLPDSFPYSIVDSIMTLYTAIFIFVPRSVFKHLLK